MISAACSAAWAYFFSPDVASREGYSAPVNLALCFDEERDRAGKPGESLIMRVGGTGYPNYQNGGWVPVETVV
jgi:hypothetical protein